MKTKRDEYEKLEMEVMVFDEEDVIVTSGQDSGIDEGEEDL